MITERQIRKLMDEHVKSMDISFKIDEIAAKVNFMAGAIAVLKCIEKNDIRFMNQIKSEQ